MKTLLLTNPFSSFVAARWGQWRAVLLLSALLCLLGGRAARAQEKNSSAGVYQVHDLTYRVWGCNFASRPSRVQMVDEKGWVLYEQRSAAINLGGWLDLSGLPDGRYAFLVRIGREEHRFAVQLRSTAQRQAEVSSDQMSATPHQLSAARTTGAER